MTRAYKLELLAYAVLIVGSFAYVIASCVVIG